MTTPTQTLPACVLGMQCYCAGHANGLDVNASCSTREPLGPKLEWGSWPVPYSAPIAWGARAIYRLGSTGKRGSGRTIATIDLLGDRQSIKFDDGFAPIEFRNFVKWIDKVAMPELRRQCVARYITADSNKTIEIESDGFKLIAGPRGSHGYLYIRAWKVA